ncbi:MAG: thioesterase family protein [Candidatus Krumholzibacteria bacterium]
MSWPPKQKESSDDGLPSLENAGAYAQLDRDGWQVKYAEEFTIRFGEVDHARVVYYPRFFHYFHRTFEDWFGDALGISYREIIVERNIGFPAVRIETQFKSPLRFGERIRVELELVRVGKKSITIRYTITRVADGVLATTAEITTVAIDNDTFKAISIPDDLRERFERFRT